MFTISRGSRSEAEVVEVRLSDGTHEGRGECVPYARYGESIASVIEQIQSISGDLAHDPGVEDLQKLLPAGAARNALDCALWDLHAKQAQKPIAGILNLDPLHPVITAFTLSLEASEIMHEKAIKNSFRPLLKIKLAEPVIWIG